MRHAWHIEPREHERQEARRGRRHAFERLDPARTALLVVDLVPFFTEENPYAAGIVPVVHALAHGVRALGGTVAWVLPAADPPTALQLELRGPAVAATYAASGGSGPLPERLAPGLDPQPADLFVEKHAASAFFPGRCELPDRLRARGIDTVLIAGTVANVCCESSARDASTLGFRVVFVADANAALRDQDLNATLHVIYRSFGDVRPAAEVLQLLSRS